MSISLNKRYFRHIRRQGTWWINGHERVSLFYYWLFVRLCAQFLGRKVCFLPLIGSFHNPFSLLCSSGNPQFDLCRRKRVYLKTQGGSYARRVDQIEWIRTSDHCCMCVSFSVDFKDCYLRFLSSLSVRLLCVGKCVTMYREVDILYVCMDQARLDSAVVCSNHHTHAVLSQWMYTCVYVAQ